MSALRPELAELREVARSETKKWGGSQVTFLHLASATALRWPDQFSAEFGAGGRDKVEQALRAGTQVGDAEAVDELLGSIEAGSAIEQVVHQLRARLDAVVTQEEPAAESAVDDAAGPADAKEGAEGAPGEASSAWEVPDRSKRFVDIVEPLPGIAGWESVVDDVIAVLGRRQPKVPLLVGDPGSGRTTTLGALAARLQQSGYEGPLAGRPVLRVRPGAILAAERASTVKRIFEDLADQEVVVVVDDLEVVSTMGGAVDMAMLVVLRAAIEQSVCRTALIIDRAYGARLNVHDAEFAQELVTVEVGCLPRPVIADIVATTAAELGSYHSTSVPDEIVRLALAPRSGRDLLTHPGLALQRLDEACTRAAVRGADEVEISDLRLGTSADVATLDHDDLADRLRSRVRGQDQAIDRLAHRLGLTRARLDLRPERPDGVFLLVGPTGVGKTELARAVADELFGSDEQMIRLDMSEYAHDWALSRLIGPQPGFVGFTEPESWLTTRVKNQPDSVVLLDEIEKAHPTVWNAFLQVFDAGRLSDARGTVADFSRTIVLMTSNMGARAFGNTSLGFGRPDDAQRTADDRIIETVRSTMAPELVNRLDGVMVFQPLSLSVIAEIARKDVLAAVDRLSERGYRLGVSDDAIELIAEEGYDEAFGARHLQRNIEKLLLEPLVGQTSLDLVTVIENGTLGWRPA